MKRFLIIILFVLLFFLIFSLQNKENIDFRLIFWSINISFTLFLIVFFIISVFISYMLLFPFILKKNKKIKELNDILIDIKEKQRELVEKQELDSIEKEKK